MNVRCPYCHEDIEERAGGVRCAKRAAPHHADCWNEAGERCVILGCDSRKHLPLTRRAAARVVLGAGKVAFQEALAHARERLGGKSIVGLFVLSCFLPAFVVTPVVMTAHVSRKVEAELALGGLFVVLVAWIATLLYRGARLEQDVAVKPVEKGPQEYFRRVWQGLGLGKTQDKAAPGAPPGQAPAQGSSGGCGDCSGCDAGGLDGEGVIFAIVVVLAAAIFILVIFPLVAWLAVEVVFPLVVLGTYGTLYSALALAVNARESLRGRLLACLGRAILFAAVYTAIAGGVLYAGLKALPPRIEVGK